MRDILALDRYPLDRPEAPETRALIAACQASLAGTGLFNLEGFVRPEAIERCAGEVRPLFETEAFTHERQHNVYFLERVAGLTADHPALRKVSTINRTLCGDSLRDRMIARIYEWPPLIAFLAAVMERPRLHTMEDPLGRVNVMSYGAGQTLNWHFDRSHFTTTLLIQAPDEGGEFQYRYNLRSDDDPNYDGVAEVLSGTDREVRTLPLAPGTLNVFKGKNTLHRVSPPRGKKERIIAVFSYYDRPGVQFSAEERLGFYGRVA